MCSPLKLYIMYYVTKYILPFIHSFASSIFPCNFPAFIFCMVEIAVKRNRILSYVLKLIRPFFLSATGYLKKMVIPFIGDVKWPS